MIPDRRREINYSKVRTYINCPYLYKLKYAEGKKEGLIAATSLGVSIHRTLEDFHSNSSDPSELIKYYNRNWMGAGYKSAAEQMEYYLKGRRMIEVYEQEEYRRASLVDATEREFIFDYEGWTLRGKIDRIDKLPDGRWEVIDYKTDAEISEDFDIKNSLQLGIYSVGARRAWHMRKGTATVYFVAHNKKISADFDSFDESKILSVFIETGKKIENMEYEPNTAYCPLCLMNNRCPYSTVRREEA